MTTRAGVVICGAGMAGVATAYHLAARHGMKDVVLVDEREPLTLTSDKGTQGYRNWWPGPDDTMFRFVSRSLDIIDEMADESGNVFRLNRRGYLFATATEANLHQMRATAEQVSRFGMGPLREHPGAADYDPARPEGYQGRPTGADLLLGDAAVRAFPFLTERTVGALHVRRAGWMNAVAMGGWMLRRAIACGARFVRDRVVAIETTGGRVAGVRLASGTTLPADRVVLAGGPALPELGRMLGIELPVFHELHAKVTFHDRLGAVPRWAPFAIWNDPVSLSWDAGEREKLDASASTRRLLEPFPGGVHARPIDGSAGDELFLIWTYHDERAALEWPPRFDPQYGEICVRGLGAMIPAMSVYASGGSASMGFVDGGYYCKTDDNRPLVGPVSVEGAYVIGALSGYGIMAAHSAADLLAAYLTSAALPDYAKWFLPSRLDDPDYGALVQGWGARVGQL